MSDVMVADKDVLLPYEADELERCESIVQSGIRTFFEVGHALQRIRDLRLYRASHGSFEKYLDDRWDYSRTYGYGLIAAAETAANVSAIGRQPENERQVRLLTKLDPETQRTAWARANELAQAMNGGRMTAWIVERAISEVKMAEEERNGDDEDDDMDVAAGKPEWRPPEELALARFGRILSTASRLDRMIGGFLRSVGGTDDLMAIKEELADIQLRLTTFRDAYFGRTTE